MSIDVLRHPSAKDLPPKWDQLTDYYFQKVKFLCHTEAYNPCRQRYYTLYVEGVLQAGCVVYTLQVDILTYLRLKSPIKMNIIGIPCSVSSSGAFGNAEYIQQLIQYVFEKEKGFILALNLEKSKTNSKYALEKTLPTIMLENRFDSWDDYLSALRYHYRRRLKHFQKKDNNISIKQIQCKQFTDKMYRQYINVYNRSKDKLEKLNCKFFQKLPDKFKLWICEKDNELLGWNITVTDGSYHYFFLGGIEYETNNLYNTYFRLLSNVVKEGIENNVKYIELGQTAEIPKTRLGGICSELFMQAKHSFPPFNALLKIFQKTLGYKRDIPECHVFKENS